MSLSQLACGHWFQLPRTHTHSVPGTYVGSLDSVPRSQRTGWPPAASQPQDGLHSSQRRPLTQKSGFLRGPSWGRPPAQQVLQRAPRHLRGLNHHVHTAPRLRASGAAGAARSLRTGEPGANTCVVLTQVSRPQDAGLFPYEQVLLETKSASLLRPALIWTPISGPPAGKAQLHSTPEVNPVPRAQPQEDAARVCGTQGRTIGDDGDEEERAGTQTEPDGARGSRPSTEGARTHFILTRAPSDGNSEDYLINQENGPTRLTADLSPKPVRDAATRPASSRRRRRSATGPGGREEDDTKATSLGQAALVIAEELL